MQKNTFYKERTIAKQVKVLTATPINDKYELTWYIPNNKPLWHHVNNKIKDFIPGRYWDPHGNKEKGCWACPINSRTTDLITQLGFRVKEGKEKVPEKKSNKKAPTLSLEYKKTELKNITDKAREYQRDNIKKIKFHDYNLYEASDMGIGKSLSLISTIREGKFKKVLIICPSTLKLNLKRECDLWLDPKDKYTIHVVRSLPKGLDLSYKNHDICIINNAMLWKHLEYIITEFKPEYVAVDESHNYNTGPSIVSKYYPDYVLKKDEYVEIVRGKKTICKKPPKRVQALDMILMGLSPEMEKQTGIKWEGVKKKLPMSGTPMPHNPENIFNWLHWLHPERFYDRYAFIDYFCKTEPGYKPNTVKITGGKNLDKLNYMLLKDYMVRVTKDEVLTELPKTTRMVIPLELEPSFRMEYDQAKDDFDEWIAKNEDENTNEDSPIVQKARRAQFKILLDLARDGKLKNCFKYVDGLLETYPDKRYVIFCHHRKVVKQVMEHYGKKAVCLVGGMNEDDKEASVQAFQNDKGIRIFCGNLIAASVGITLHRSDTVIFFETGFSSHIVQQAQDRVRRIGQKSDIVQAIFLPAEETIEKYIIAKLDKKKAMSDKAIDGIDTDEKDMLSFLWELMSKKT